jgi:hypothetical protein
MSALRFPEHFPPTDRWKKFFIGVRWLGPDLSFFKGLKTQQAQRSLKEMAAWGGGQRQRLAEAISCILARQLGWKSPVFLPQDSAAVAFHGPRFDFNDPESAFEEVLEVLTRDFGISVPKAFWIGLADRTLGEVIDGLLSLPTFPSSA